MIKIKKVNDFTVTFGLYTYILNVEKFNHDIDISDATRIESLFLSGNLFLQRTDPLLRSFFSSSGHEILEMQGKPPEFKPYFIVIRKIWSQSL